MNIELNTSIEHVMSWIKENKMVERSKETCLLYLKNYYDAHKEEFEDMFPTIKDFSRIVPTLHKTDLCLNNDSFEDGYMYIVIYIRIEYGEEEVGYYKSVFDLNGEDVDDYIMSVDQVSLNF
tara:strand:- start:309 stop:674 length:366 start_codon:yes stop_codon:yes gene_type:complete